MDSYRKNKKKERYPIAPDRATRPRPGGKQRPRHRTVDLRFPQGAQGLDLDGGQKPRQQAEAGDLQTERRGPQSVGRWTRRAGHRVGEQTAGVHGELLAGLQHHLVDLAAADQSDETAACQFGVAPVGETLDMSVSRNRRGRGKEGREGGRGIPFYGRWSAARRSSARSTRGGRRAG